MDASFSMSLLFDIYDPFQRAVATAAKMRSGQTETVLVHRLVNSLSARITAVISAYSLVPLEVVYVNLDTSGITKRHAFWKLTAISNPRFIW